MVKFRLLLCPVPSPGPRPSWHVTPLWSGTSKPGPLLNLSAVPGDQRAAVWQRLKAERPAQAELISSEPVQALRAAFDADLLVEALNE